MWYFSVTFTNDAAQVAVAHYRGFPHIRSPILRWGLKSQAKQDQGGAHVGGDHPATRTTNTEAAATPKIHSVKGGFPPDYTEAVPSQQHCESQTCRRDRRQCPAMQPHAQALCTLPVGTWGRTCGTWPEPRRRHTALHLKRQIQFSDGLLLTGLHRGRGTRRHRCWVSPWRGRRRLLPEETLGHRPGRAGPCAHRTPRRPTWREWAVLCHYQPRRGTARSHMGIIGPAGKLRREKGLGS